MYSKLCSFKVYNLMSFDTTVLAKTQTAPSHSGTFPPAPSLSSPSPPLTSGNH